MKSNALNTICLLILFSFLSLKISPVFAVETLITSVPETIGKDPFQVSVSVNGAGSGTNYLKIDLYRSDTTDYFGETENNGNWYTGSDYTQYPEIIVTENNSWTGTLTGRISPEEFDKIDSQGNYFIRIRRYTGSGNYNSQEAKNSAKNIKITAAVPTNQITPSPIFITESAGPSQNQDPVKIKNVFITEIMAWPNENQPEWVELYNDNDSEVFLQNWFIDDVEEVGSSPKIFTLTIPKKAYRTIEFTSTIFNNDTDSVRLLDQSKNVVDAADYETNKSGLSLGKKYFSDIQLCPQNPSPQTENSTCVNVITPSVKPTPKPLLTSQKIDDETPVNDPTNISEKITSESESLTFFGSENAPVIPSGQILGDNVDRKDSYKNPYLQNESKTGPIFIQITLVLSLWISLFNSMHITFKILNKQYV